MESDWISLLPGAYLKVDIDGCLSIGVRYRAAVIMKITRARRH